MLVIRKEQIEKLEEVAAKRFEHELVDRMMEFSPKSAEVIGEEGVREVVLLGMDRAGKYGLTKRGPIRFYVELMFMFGSDFDTDFQLPWAGGVLTNEIIKDEMERADILHENLVEYLKEVAGEDKEYSLKALRKLTKAHLEEYRAAGSSFETQMRTALRDIYPQKYGYLGEEKLATLLQRAQDSAKSHSITSEQGNALFVALTFALGHGFASDPLYPWVKSTLEDESLADPNKRAERLEEKARIFFERALEYLEERKN